MKIYYCNFILQRAKEKICIEDYKYEREAVNDASEMLYYDGIEDLLSDLTEDDIEPKLQENK